MQPLILGFPICYLSGAKIPPCWEPEQGQADSGGPWGREMSRAHSSSPQIVSQWTWLPLGISTRLWLMGHCPQGLPGELQLVHLLAVNQPLGTCNPPKMDNMALAASHGVLAGAALGLGCTCHTFNLRCHIPAPKLLCLARGMSLWLAGHCVAP